MRLFGLIAYWLETLCGRVGHAQRARQAAREHVYRYSLGAARRNFKTP